MIDSNILSDLFDAIPETELSEEAKAACQKASAYFGELIHKDEENIFSNLASGEKKSLSQLLKVNIPGDRVCAAVEQLRQAIFTGAPRERIVELYFISIEDTFHYLDCNDIIKKIDPESMIEAVLAFYEAHGKRCFTVSEENYKNVKNGVVASFRPFFEEYLAKYRAQMKEIMDISSFGAERNEDAAYRKTMFRFIELLLCYAVFYSYQYELSAASFDRFTKRLGDSTMRDQEAFYQLWLQVNNEVMEDAYAGETFSDLLFDVGNVYSELMIVSKHQYEKNLANVPVAKESDMRDLYKTVYELRKELAQVKKELREVKGC